METKLWAINRLEDARTPIITILRGDAYEDFLLSYIRRERAQFRAGGRDRRLCRCTWDCPIKQGSLPMELDTADNIDSGIRAYKRAHAAQPIVLDEARKQWAIRVSQLESVLNEIYAALASDERPGEAALTEIPEITLVATPDDDTVAEQSRPTAD